MLQKGIYVEIGYYFGKLNLTVSHSLDGRLEHALVEPVKNTLTTY